MIDYENLINWRFPKVTHHLTQRDTMLYALGIGLGMDSTDRAQLRFVYEKNLVAFPSMASVLCFPGNWLKDSRTGVDYLKIVNGATRFVIHQPLPVEATLTSTMRVIDIVDKGKGKGAIVVTEREVCNEKTGDLVCTVTATTFCRGDGGFGGPKRSLPPPPTISDTPPDVSIEIIIPTNAALIFRLLGDYNPLHADMDVATAAGFARPILHGLATLGFATHALVKGCGNYDPPALKSLEARYTAPVMPGDTLCTMLWRNGSNIRFRSVVKERSSVVLDHGCAVLSVPH